MPIQKNLRSPRIVALAIALLLTSFNPAALASSRGPKPAPARADDVCPQSLMGEKAPLPTAMETHRSLWLQYIHQELGVTRGLSDLEFEAIVDVLHDLSLRAFLSGGEEVVLIDHPRAWAALNSVLELGQFLRVEYNHTALRRIADIYANACRVLKRDGCEIYDDALNFQSKSQRPFSAIQEQVLKWATLHQLQAESTIDLLAQVEPEVRQMQMQAIKAMRLALSHQLLDQVFTREEVTLIYHQFAKPLIDSTHENVERRIRNIKAN